MDQPEPKTEDIQKLIKKMTRLAAFGFLLGGVLILLLDGNMILGAILALIGLTDIIFVPHILATIITAHINRINDKG